MFARFDSSISNSPIFIEFSVVLSNCNRPAILAQEGEDGDEGVTGVLGSGWLLVVPWLLTEGLPRLRQF